MRICIASKFPPIEGGIAARTYWRVLHLLERGDEVTLVTNADCVEAEHQIVGCEGHLSELTELYPLRIESLSTDVPWHIPASPDYLERLTSTLIRLLSTGDFETVESGFLVPYGVAAHFASQASGVPHVLRHGASDLSKFLSNPEYRPLLECVIHGASAVVTDERHAPLFADLGVDCLVEPIYTPNREAFRPVRKDDGGAARVYGVVGKINYHWRRKGLDRIVDWYASQDPSTVELRVIGQGIGLSDFSRWARGRLGGKVEIHPFVPPWDMPGLLSQLDAVFCLSVDDPIPADSMLRQECEAMGIEVIDDLSPYC